MPDGLIPLLAAAGTGWIEVKAFAESALGISNDALHVILGVVLHLALAAIWRGSLARIWPWAMVLLLQLGNEVVDLATERWPSPGEQFGESAKDIALTMILPSLLLVLARFWPAVLGTRPEHDLEG